MLPGPKVPAAKKTEKFQVLLRNIREGAFVYTNAAGYGLSQASQSFGIEKPRGGSRGANDTQFFRPLVQEEVVS